MRRGGGGGDGRREEDGREDLVVVGGETGGLDAVDVEEVGAVAEEDVEDGGAPGRDVDGLRESEVAAEVQHLRPHPRPARPARPGDVGKVQVTDEERRGRGFGAEHSKELHQMGKILRLSFSRSARGPVKEAKV